MNSTPTTVGVFVHGPPTSPRGLVRHADLLTAYADGSMAEQGEDREAYLSHYTFGPEMKEHYSANRQSVAGYSGPCGARHVVFDIDRPDPADALTDARRLVQHLRTRYPEAQGNLPIYFSGGKGFHILVELVHTPPPDDNFPHVARAFAEGIAAEAAVAIDVGIYDVNHIVRLPNTRHPGTGRYKTRIDEDALFGLSMDGILSQASHPAGDGLPSMNACPARLADDWAAAVTATIAAENTRAARRASRAISERAPRYFLEFLRFQTPVGQRHGMVFRCAGWLTEERAPSSLCYKLLTEPGLDSGLTPKDVARQIQCGIEHARRQRGLPPDEEFDDDLERWAIQHESDPLDFPYGALEPTPGRPE